MEIISIIYRNIAFRRPLPYARATRIGGAVQLELTLPRHLNVSPGDYVNLWIPGLGLRSFF